LLDRLTKGLGKLIDFLDQNSAKIEEFGQNAISFIFETLPKIGQEFEKAKTAIISFGLQFQPLWQIFQPVLMGLWDLFMNWVWPSIVEMGKALMGLWNVISPYVVPTLKILGFILGVFIVGSILLFIGAIKVATAMISQWANEVRTRIETVQNVVSEITNRFQRFKNIVINVFNEVSKIDLFETGVNIIKGLISGLGSMAGKLYSMVTDTANGIANGFKNALGIKSPSKLFAEFGRCTAEGFQIGVESQNVQTAQATASLAQSASAGAISVQQSNSININGTQNPNAIMQQVKQYLATQNQLAFNGVL